MSTKNLLEVKNLSIAFGTNKSKVEVVQDISFDLPENTVLGIVGESGSGKSVTSLALMGLLPKKGTTLSGSVKMNGKEVFDLNPKEFRNYRGKEVAMIFQEPMTALNPAIKCGRQVMEPLQQHLNISRTAAKQEVLRLFEKVKLPEPESIFSRYPHQISGGQMQRVMIAMAISCKPQLLIADEPTTALDVTVQKEIIALLKEIQQETGMALIFISHDLNLVSEIADKVMVLFRGKMVEHGSVYSVFKLPKAAYTKALLAARPGMDVRLERLPTIEAMAENSFSPQEILPKARALRHKKMYTKPPLLEVDNVSKTYVRKLGLFGGSQEVKAVKSVSFSIFEGETLGLVGESGCGKSTLGKTILQLEKASTGSIRYRGKTITDLDAAAWRSLRKEIQIIFQDPYSSLNPRTTIGACIMEPMLVHGVGKSASERRRRTLELLERVGLDVEYFGRYPHELSGGQRQRVGVARTIAMNPKLVICDESVSALDISVQAQVLNLLNELKDEFGFTYLFISHDLAVVKYMSDQLMVMSEGRIEELGDADEIYANPRSPYTQKLIDAIPKGL